MTSDTQTESMPIALMTAPRRGIINAWRRERDGRFFLVETLLTFLVLALVMRFCGLVMNIMELRKGVSLPDPILTSFQPFNLTWPIFIILWLSIFITLFHLLYYPRYFVIALQAMTILLVFRTIALGLMPLEPMKSIIPLQDPIVMSLGTGKLIIKDLFFSGHTATMTMCTLASRWLPWKIVCLIGTIAVGSGVILQHVHYSCDVFAAPFFSYASWRIALLINMRRRTV